MISISPARQQGTKERIMANNKISVTGHFTSENMDIIMARIQIVLKDDVDKEFKQAVNNSAIMKQLLFKDRPIVTYLN